MALDEDTIRLAGPQGRVILKIAPDKVNTPAKLAR